MDVVAKIRLGVDFKEQLKNLEHDVLSALFTNLISPLEKNYSVHELEGKYKPSWEVSLANQCPFRAGLADAAKKHDLHHYHFGHTSYRQGRDPKYAGLESAGIVHTSFTSTKLDDSLLETHTLFRVDTSHPTPFSFPLNLSVELE
jgi:hypothetical protein